MLAAQATPVQRILIGLYRLILSSPVLRFLLRIGHPELGSIAAFVHSAGQSLAKGALVLDAGAGSQFYKPFFAQCVYHATDFCAIDKVYEGRLHFVSDLGKGIPVRDGVYDAVINISVLEHVPDPQFVIDEFVRVLKPGGSLYLSAPQGWGLHDEPHHYFNFTKYGLGLLFKRAGFRIDFIKERGGFFHYLAVRLQELPHIFARNVRRADTFLFALPLFLVFLPLSYLVFPPILFVADIIFDRERKFTLGYACRCTKPYA